MPFFNPNEFVKKSPKVLFDPFFCLNVPTNNHGKMYGKSSGHYFRRKLAKIVEISDHNLDHNIDPRGT
jgi:hypothetical protein